MTEANRLLDFFTSDGRICLTLELEDARAGSHSGRCDDDIAALRKSPYIAEQLDKLSPALVSAELKEYGAWDEIERADHDANLSRLLWLACGDVRGV